MSKTTACHDRCKAPAQGSVKKVARAAWKKIACGYKLPVIWHLYEKYMISGKRFGAK